MKDDRFYGFRFDWTHANKLGKSVEYKNSWTINSSLENGEIPDPNDVRGTVPCDLICVDGTGALTDCGAGGAIPLTDETSIRKKTTDLILNTSLVIKL